MNTLIIYYSKSGMTKIVAQTLAKNIGADILEIVDLKERNSISSKLTASFDAFRENKTKILPNNIDLTDYDVVYIGTPVWAGKPAPAITTIIDKLLLRGKDVILFSTMSSSGGDTTNERMAQKVKMRGGRTVESFTLKTKDKTTADIVKSTEVLINSLDLNLYNN